MEKDAPPSIDKAEGTEDGIQHGDASEVGKRTEVRDALAVRSIIDTHRLGNKTNTMPCRHDQQKQFGFVARRQDAQAMQMAQRVSSVTALGICQLLPRLEGEPEVAETIGKGIALRHVFLLEGSLSHDQCSIVIIHGLEEQRQILGIVLAVAIDGNGIIIPHGAGCFETDF